MPLAGLKTRMRSSGNSEQSGCRAFFYHIAPSAGLCSLTFVSLSAESALTQQVDLSHILGHSETLNLKVNYD